ncbi:MAG: hypothetical protein IPK76_16040 [Lewinellaceae bacterium]|nr:hypothetical protein [Lewinellaceae bacterium]
MQGVAAGQPAVAAAIRRSRTAQANHLVTAIAARCNDEYLAIGAVRRVAAVYGARSSTCACAFQGGKLAEAARNGPDSLPFWTTKTPLIVAPLPPLLKNSWVIGPPPPPVAVIWTKNGPPVCGAVQVVVPGPLIFITVLLLHWALSVENDAIPAQQE